MTSAGNQAGALVVLKKSGQKKKKKKSPPQSERGHFRSVAISKEGCNFLTMISYLQNPEEV